MVADPEGRSARWLALDGLRSLAVLVVVAFHANGLLGHGSLGVDVFFVLSGFLITSLLVAEWDRRGRIDLRRFYVKRFLRLAPALVVLCAAVVVIAVVSASRPREVAEGAVASALYVANLWLYSGHDMPLLQHTWTLALESQFYLLWPVLIGLVLTRRRVGVVLLLVLVALSVGADAVGVAPVAYTYARAVGLPLGCSLALLLRRADRTGPVARVAYGVSAPLGRPA
jgi:peptidoglycan/LPS O-acetylase OafA/YrhL